MKNRNNDPSTPTQIIQTLERLYLVSKESQKDLTDVIKQMMLVIDAYPDAPWKNEPIIERIRREIME